MTAAVARRLRGQLAEQMISKKLFCELTGWNRMHTYRRLRGDVALDTDELGHIERTAGICAEYLMTGHECAHPPHPHQGGPPSPLRNPLPTPPDEISEPARHSAEVAETPHNRPIFSEQTLVCSVRMAS